jgi:DNA polymerase III subunit delta'
VFEDIPGQPAAKRLFRHALANDSLSHAYLLAGPEGLGKLEFALEVAVAVVSPCGGCGECLECERARRGAHPDLRLIQREGERIRLAQIEPLVAELALKPFSGERRVWILTDVEQLMPEAANKLLKSIEEPPAHVYFLLVTDGQERVLPTVVSRCQIVEFRPLADAEIEAYLRERHGLEGDEARALARLARGSVERAERDAADAGGPRLREEYLRFAGLALGGSRPEGAGGTEGRDAVESFLGVLDRRLEAVRHEVKDGLDRRLAEIEASVPDKRDQAWHIKRAEALARREEDRRARQAAVDAFELLAAWVHDLWAVACDSPQAAFNCDRLDELRQTAVARPERYEALLAVAGETRRRLYLNVDRRLALQAMFARFEEVARSA